MRDRLPLAAACALVALGLLSLAGNVLGAGDVAARVLAATLALQAAWVVGSVAVAAALPGRVGERLGLGAGGLPVWANAVLVLGFLALSSGLHHLIAGLGLRSSGALGRIGELLDASEGGVLLLAVLAVGLAPAVGEEVLFRGLLQRSFARRAGQGVAVVAAAALFGVAHGDLVHGSAAFVLGIYLGTAAAIAGSIRTSILCHAVNNLAGVLAGTLAGGLGPAAPAGMAVTLLAFAVAALAVVAWRGARRAATAPPPTSAPRGEGPPEPGPEPVGSGPWPVDGP